MKMTILILGIVFLGAFSGCAATKNKAFHITGPAEVTAGMTGLSVQMYDGAQYLSNPCPGVTLKPNEVNKE